MKKCFIILLAVMLATCCVGCMIDNGIEPLYENVEDIRQEIIELEKDNEKLEKDNKMLEEELQELSDNNLSKEKVEKSKEHILLEDEFEKSQETKLGITPTEYIYYLFNLSVIEKEFEDLYVDSTPYKYTWDDGTIIYVYTFTYNKKNNRVVFLELELAGDGKHVEKIKLYYQKENGDIKQYKIYKQYIKMVSYAFVMVKEEAKELDDEVLEKAKSFFKNNIYDKYNRSTLDRQNYDTFTISGY